MKTNVSIELSDSQRNHISNIYHSKESKSLATRKEINDLVLGFIEALNNSDGLSHKEVVHGVIKEGYRYFMNDLEISGERFHDIVNSQQREELSNEIEMKKEEV